MTRNLELSPEQFATFRLMRTPNIGPITYHKLIQKYKSAQNAIDALPDFSRNRQKPLIVATRSEAEDEIAKVQDFGAELLFHDDDLYPPLLTQIHDAPPVLTYKGNINVLRQDICGIVGARNASLSGIEMTKRISSALGQAGYAIASGLARGIDTIAHEQTYQTGTIAVVAGGVDVIYPSENTDLYHTLQEQGCIIAESPFGCEPQARHFPKRNRIISGLSRAVLVIEAALKSGSLITAQQAADQGRDVFAIPGSPMDPRAAGTNKLLQDGAYLTTCAQDMIDILGRQTIRPVPQKQKQTNTDLFTMPPEKAVENKPENSPKSQNPKSEGDNLSKELLSLLSHTPVDIDLLIRQSGHAAADVQTILLELELSGHIEKHPGNKVNLI